MLLAEKDKNIKLQSKLEEQKKIKTKYVSLHSRSRSKLQFTSAFIIK